MRRWRRQLDESVDPIAGMPLARCKQFYANWVGGSHPGGGRVMMGDDTYEVARRIAMPRFSIRIMMLGVVALAIVFSIVAARERASCMPRRGPVSEQH